MISQGLYITITIAATTTKKNSDSLSNKFVTRIPIRVSQQGQQESLHLFMYPESLKWDGLLVWSLHQHY